MADMQSITQIREQFRSEWLLIAVQETDEQTTTPLKGTLVDHGPLPEPLWKKSATIPGVTMVIYSDEWPEDLAACFLLA